MTRTANDDDQNAIQKQTIGNFKHALNMTAAQLEKWLVSEESKRVGQKLGSDESVGHRSGRRIIELPHRREQDLSEDDLAHMRKVIGYIHRHLAQGPSKSDPAIGDWRYSLMN